MRLEPVSLFQALIYCTFMGLFLFVDAFDNFEVFGGLPLYFRILLLLFPILIIVSGTARMYAEEERELEEQKDLNNWFNNYYNIDKVRQMRGHNS